MFRRFDGSVRASIRDPWRKEEVRSADQDARESNDVRSGSSPTRDLRQLGVQALIERESVVGGGDRPAGGPLFDRSAS